MLSLTVNDFLLYVDDCLDAMLQIVTDLDVDRDRDAGDDEAYPFGRTQGGVLNYLFHELAQHLGQMEVTRNVLAAGASVDGP